MSLPPADLGYVAAALDLKGLILVKKNQSRATPQIVIAVESRIMPLIHTLARLTGTNPELQEPKKPAEWMRTGCAIHCPEKHVHVNAMGADAVMPATARWTITGAAAAVVLYNVMPYLRTSDKGWSDVFVDLLKNVTLTGQGWGAVAKTIRRLRDLGWDLPPAFDAALRLQDEEWKNRTEAMVAKVAVIPDSDNDA